MPMFSVPVLLSTLQLLRSVCGRNDVFVRFRCLFILPYSLRFVKWFFMTFFAALEIGSSRFLAHGFAHTKRRSRKTLSVSSVFKPEDRRGSEEPH